MDSNAYSMAEIWAMLGFSDISPTEYLKIKITL
jgi:hypothetical protein